MQAIEKMDSSGAVDAVFLFHVFYSAGVLTTLRCRKMLGDEPGYGEESEERVE